MDKQGDKNALFEAVLTSVGGFGRFQYGMLLLSLVASFCAACNHLGPIYLNFAPGFECKDNIASLTTGGDEISYPSTCPSENSTCSKGYAYDPSVMTSSFVTEFDLICERRPLVPTIASTYMAGVVVFNFLGGFLSDQLGRRKVLVTSILIHVLCSFLTAFSTSYPMLIAVRFFVGGSIHAAWTATFVICTEVAVAKRRGIVGAVLNMGWNIGSILMTFLAYLLRSWFSLQLSFAIMSCFLVLYLFIIPESPRWLLSRKRPSQENQKRAKDVYMRIARINGISDLEPFETHFDKLMNRIEQEAAYEQSDSSALSSVVRLFSTTELQRRVLLMILPWLCVGMSAYGIHFSVRLVDMNIFLLAAIKELAIILCVLCIMQFYERLSRSAMLSTLFFLGGICGVLFLLVPASQVITRTVLFILCQALIVTDFFLVDTYTHEVFSTDVRNTAFSLLDSISKFGTLISPYVVDLGGDKNPGKFFALLSKVRVNTQQIIWSIRLFSCKRFTRTQAMHTMFIVSYIFVIYSKTTTGLPPAVFGASMILAGLVFFVSPETKDQPLRQNASDLSSKDKTLISSIWRKITA